MVEKVPMFESDEKAAKYWAKKYRSELVGEKLDRVEAIRLFREGKVDILLPESGLWKGYRLRDSYEIYRGPARKITERHHALLLKGSIA